MSVLCRVLVTGASGVLGRAVVTQLEQQGHQVLGTAYSRSHGGKFTLLDLCDQSATSKLLHDYKPDVIVHCAAERHLDVMEKDGRKGRELNVSVAAQLSKLALDIGAWVLYISTSYVFDGKEPPFAEDDKRTNPLNKYGRSKLDGEVEVLSVNSNNAVLRVPVLYGQVERLDESPVTAIFQNVLKTDQKCVMSHYERRYPTSVHDLAIVIEEMVGKRDQLKGYFHWRGREEMTKYEMSIVMANLFDLPTDHIVAGDMASGFATRAYNADLECKRLAEYGIGKKFTPFKEGIKECLEPWANEMKAKVKMIVDQGPRRSEK